MNERERLIELLNRYFTIGDSYAYNLTRVKEAFAIGTVDINDFVEFDESVIENVADFLLENGVIVLPCTDKTTVYEVQVNTEACKGCEHYSEFYGMDEFCDRDFSEYAYPRFAETPYCEKQFWEIVEWKPSKNWIFDNRNSFGKTVFLTKEEAEKALAEKRADND